MRCQAPPKFHFVRRIVGWRKGTGRETIHANIVFGPKYGLMPHQLKQPAFCCEIHGWNGVFDALEQVGITADHSVHAADVNDRTAAAPARIHALKPAPNAEGLADPPDDATFRRTQALIDSTPERIASLAAFPQTLLHHDLVRSNLFALSAGETAAIDWENVGRGPFGVDLAPLVIGSVRRGEASADDLPAIEEAVLGSYVAALRDHGDDNEADVRAAYRLAIGLRWHVVLGAIGSWLDPTSWGMRGSRRDEPRDDALGHLVKLTRHIIDLGLADDPMRRRVTMRR